MTIAKKFSALRAFNRPKLDTGNELLTEQSHSRESDINFLIARFRKTGIPIQTKKHVAQYLDVSSVPTYEDAFNHVQATNDLFNSLPVKIRDRFKNSPKEFLSYVSNPENIKELESLGLLEIKPDLKDQATGGLGGDPPSNAKHKSKNAKQHSGGTAGEAGGGSETP